MAATLEALVRDALILPPADRATLAHHLLASLDPEPDPGAEAAWEEEIARRIASVRAGEKGIPGEEVFSRLREIFP